MSKIRFIVDKATRPVIIPTQPDRPISPPAYGNPPSDWVGTIAEWVIAWALTKLNIIFQQQRPASSIRSYLGYTQIDFYLPDYNLIIQIVGEGFSQESLNELEMFRISLESIGYNVVFILSRDAKRNPFFYVREALKYQDHSKGG